MHFFMHSSLNAFDAHRDVLQFEHRHEDKTYDFTILLTDAQRTHGNTETKRYLKYWFLNIPNAV